MTHGFRKLPELEQLEQVAERLHLGWSELEALLEEMAGVLFPAGQPSQLNHHEMEVLRDLEIIDRKPAHPEQRASLLAAAKYLTIIELSYRLNDVAEMLGIQSDDVMKLAQNGSLYMLERQDDLLFPTFQFAGGVLVPGLGDVLPRLPQDMDVLEVVGFLNTPAFELVRDGIACTPREWLTGGGSVAPVAKLADELSLPS